MIMQKPNPPRDPAIRITLLPRDTNPHGTIFGGVILSYIDQAAAVAAKRVTRHKIVTVSMHEVVFKKPVYVGDLISFYADVTKVGRTSIWTKVIVEAQREERPEDVVGVTEAVVVFVSVDDAGRPVPVDASRTTG
jgi:acyl-CoA thioesterase YciA